MSLDKPIDSKVYIDMKVPKGEKFFAECIFYRISDKPYTFHDKSYIIGQKVQLVGKNVQELNGASILISQVKLSDIIPDSYYTDLVYAEHFTYAEENTMNADDSLLSEKSAEVVNAEEILQPYINNLYLTTFNFTLNNIAISDNVEIEKAIIGDTEFSFDTFKIIPIDLPRSDYDLLYKCIEFNSMGGHQEGPKFSEMEYYEVDGKALKPIKSITIQALDPYQTQINENNAVTFERRYKNYQYQYKKFKTTDFASGDSVLVTANFAFEGMDSNVYRKYDSAIISICTTFTTQDKTNIYLYENLPIIRDPVFSLVHFYHAIKGPK